MGKPFHSREFAKAIKSRSQNMPGFLAAVLRQEGLLASDPEKMGLVHLAGDWKAWRKSVYTETPAKPVAATPQVQEAPITDEQLLQAVQATPEKKPGRKKKKAPPSPEGCTGGGPGAPESEIPAQADGNAKP